ncbi:hypothetical protein DAC22_17 [Bacteroides phage DAC22]|nr:hypothetical protein DAC22_17 [Bacteroides phage DAC22]
MATILKSDIIKNINDTISVLVNDFYLDNLYLNRLVTNKYNKQIKYLSFDELIEVDKEFNKILETKQKEKREEEFKSTEEGIKILNFIEEKRKYFIKSLDDWTLIMKNLLENKIKSVLGKDWNIKEIDNCGCILFLNDENNKKIFASEVKIYFEDSYDIDNKDLRTNIGTSGEVTFDSSRAKYYVGVGKLLDNKELQNEMLSILWKVKKQHLQHFTLFKKIRDIKNNPYSHKDTYIEELTNLKIEE